MSKYEPRVPIVVPFRAMVIDAGGGEVRLLVDRDTQEYPEDGARVLVVLDDGAYIGRSGGPDE